MERTVDIIQAYDMTELRLENMFYDIVFHCLEKVQNGYGEDGAKEKCERKKGNDDSGPERTKVR
jgi:hypothetical protein